MRLMGRLVKDTIGTAAMEFAICMPLLVSLVIGFAEFGRAIWCHHMIAQMARDAARYVSHGGSQANASQLAEFGSLTGTTPLMPAAYGAVTMAYTTTALACPACIGQPQYVTAIASFTFTSNLFAWFNLPITIGMAAAHSERLQAS